VQVAAADAGGIMVAADPVVVAVPGAELFLLAEKSMDDGPLPAARALVGGLTMLDDIPQREAIVKKGRGVMIDAIAPTAVG